MYKIDRNDKVNAISSAPECDAGAPLPVVISDRHNLYLLYIVSEPDPSWDGSYITSISPNTEDTMIAIITFQKSYAHMFGPPNDESINGHPLYRRGLVPYGVFEIENSSWIRNLEKMNSVHPYHRKEKYQDYKHFIFSFHDSTFECIAKAFSVSTERGSIDSILTKVAQSLYSAEV